MLAGNRFCIFVFSFCSFVALINVVRAQCAELYRLSQLSAGQRTELFQQIDAFGMLTAFLNYCHRPPNMIA
jgi:hypothetical protein